MKSPISAMGLAALACIGLSQASLRIPFDPKCPSQDGFNYRLGDNTFTIECFTDREGKQLAQVPRDTFHNCMLDCIRYEKCYYVSYNPFTSTCTITSKYGPRVKSTSGLRKFHEVLAARRTKKTSLKRFVNDVDEDWDFDDDDDDDDDEWNLNDIEDTEDEEWDFDDVDVSQPDPTIADKVNEFIKKLPSSVFPDSVKPAPTNGSNSSLAKRGNNSNPWAKGENAQKVMNEVGMRAEASAPTPTPTSSGFYSITVSTKPWGVPPSMSPEPNDGKGGDLAEKASEQH